jgi:hypothetical protein
MTISYLGSLPVSSLNVGLNAALGALTLEIAQLEVDLSGLVPAIAGQLQLAIDLPNIPAFTANLAVLLDPIAVALELSPGGITLNGIEAAADLAIELGLIEAKLEALLAITVPLELGLGAGGIAGWSYSGGARAFGEALRTATPQGWGDTLPGDEVSAVIVATESPSSWSAFGSTFQVGTAQSWLRYLGEYGATRWNLGLGTLMLRVRAFLAKLQALKARIEYQLQILVGVDLPSVSVMIDVGAEIVAALGIDGLMGNLAVDADLTLAIEGIEARIQVIVDLMAELSASLSAGGLSAWAYSGSAGLLGAEFLSAVLNGLPGGGGANAEVDGLVLAATPEAMSLFSNIFAS